MKYSDFSLSEFEQLYKDKLGKLAATLEPQRKKYHQQLTYCQRLSSFFTRIRWVLVFLILYYALTDKPSGYLISFALVFAVTVSKGLCDGKIATIKLDFKKNIKKVLYSKLFDLLQGYKYEYADTKKIADLSDELLRLNIFGAFTNLFCDDCLFYKDDETNLEIYDISVSTKIFGYKTRITKTNFEGILITAPCYKDFKGTTIIKPKNNIRAFSDIMTSLERVNLEDAVFEDIFDVYTTNQIEARYLITTAFMERLIKAFKDNTKKQILCSFEKGKVYIGIEDSKDWFEIPIDKPLKDLQDIRCIFEELQVVTELVSTLKLENKTGL